MRNDSLRNMTEQWANIHEADCGQTDTCENITFPWGRYTNSLVTFAVWPHMPVLKRGSTQVE